MTEFKITKVKKATTVSETVATTIPIEWARLLGIKDGDWVRWEMSPEGNRLILRKQE